MYWIHGDSVVRPRHKLVPIAAVPRMSADPLSATPSDWWQKLEAKAKLDRVRGHGWHSLRRKFATDLKHDTPLADLCALGGWKDHNTVLRCYTRPDEVTMRAALARRAQRRASG